MSGHRTERVERQLLEELANIVEHDLYDPSVGMVTFTSVRVSGDLSHARVYFSRLGTEEEQEQCRKGLQRAAGFLRRELAHRARLRHTPELVFQFDDTLETAERISRLLTKTVDLDEK
ncbi:MAG: 30S ribosome-binding factor RbfA [Candidatus Binatia bacterium]